MTIVITTSDEVQSVEYSIWKLLLDLYILKIKLKARI